MNITSESFGKLVADREKVLGELSPSKRVDELAEAMQVMKDSPYKPSTYKCVPRFCVGDEVVVCSGHYYFGKILIVGKFRCTDLMKTVPMYKVIYRDWKTVEKGREWVMEYDIIGLHKHFLSTEHLMAHYYNFLKELPADEEKRKGLFALTEEELQVKLQAWSELFAQKSPNTPLVGFKEWIGLQEQP